MKLKTLAALCKKEGVFNLYDKVDGDGARKGQYMGTHAAIYQLSALPYIEAENICAMFDITAKQQEKISITQNGLKVEERLEFGDTYPGETLLDKPEMRLEYGPHILLPLFTRQGLTMINAEYLAPLADVADDLELYERRTPNGNTYIAAKFGFMLEGVIMPIKVVDEMFVAQVEELARRANVALRDKG
jgi:hypothetical protein